MWHHHGRVAAHLLVVVMVVLRWRLVVPVVVVMVVVHVVLHAIVHQVSVEDRNKEVSFIISFHIKTLSACILYCSFRQDVDEYSIHYQSYHFYFFNSKLYIMWALL